MATSALGNVLREIHRLAGAQEARDLTDGQLLERFRGGEEAALTLLIQRHGPMVLGVCRRILTVQADAEDAFQATFLVLARKTGSIRKQESLGSWLYGVAYRVARKARAREYQRRFRERRATPMRPTQPTDDLTWQELRAVLDEELNRLPERYRAPLVHCYLEGKTHAQAAGELGLPRTSLTSRLARARDLLRKALTRRGVSLPAAVLATVLAEKAAPAAVPALLTLAAVQAATRGAAGKAAAGLVSPGALALAEEALPGLSPLKLKMILGLLVLTLAAAGTTLAQLARPAAAETEPSPSSPRKSEGPRPARLDARGDPLPAGAVGRLGTLRFRHLHTISALAFSTDGTKIVSSSWDETVRLWDAASGRQLGRFTGGGEGFNSAAISPDGKVVSGGTMKAVYLWDAATGKRLRCLADLESTTFALRFSADGKRLAGESGDVMHVWEVATGREVGRLALPGVLSRHPFFTPDLKTAAAGCKDGTLRLWDLATGKELRRWPSGQADLGVVTLSPDEKRLASGGGSTDRGVRLWDVATGRELHRWGPYGGWVDSLAFSPDGKALATGDQCGIVRIYDTATGKEKARCGLQGNNWVLALAFSPDGKTLAAGGAQEKMVRRFDAATGKELRPYPGHLDEVTALVVLPDRKTLLSGGRDGQLLRWDLTTGKEVPPRQTTGGIQALALAPDGKTLAVAASGRFIRLQDPDTGKEAGQVPIPGGPREFLGFLAFSPDNKLLAFDCFGKPVIHVWDLAAGKERFALRPPGDHCESIPFAFTPDGKTLISGSADSFGHPFCVWDLATGKEVRRLPGLPLTSTNLALSPDGRLLATTGWGPPVVQVTEVATGQVLWRFKAYSSVLAFSPDGRLLAAGGVDGIIHLWEMATGQERRRFRGHRAGGEGRKSISAGVSALLFTPDGRTLISGGGDTTVLLWDLSGAPTGRQLPAALTPFQLEKCWAELEGDAGPAYQAIQSLTRAGPAAVAYFKERLRPVRPAEPRRLVRLVADLDSNRYPVRRRAFRELEELGESALPGLRKALSDRPSPEVRKRLEQLLHRLQGPVPRGKTLQAVRAVEVLERIGTPEARELLKALAGGTPEARQTQEARAALGRLKQQ